MDGQPITDQQSKIFSNQIPLDAIQSMEVISGAPPAEYGDKTSVVINVTTQSGQGVTTPHGSVTTSYGSFGTSQSWTSISRYGGKNWGNFISASGLNSGRFLDPPEFAVMHDKGNEENLFDRVDYQLSTADFDSSEFRLHALVVSDAELVRLAERNAVEWVVVNNGGLDPSGNRVGPADQRSQIKTFNIAPSWTRLISSTTVFTLGAFVRRDQFNYYPSGNPFADLGPTEPAERDCGTEPHLTNAGLRSDLSYVKGIHNLKVGAVYEQTFLNENDQLGIVDPTLLPSLIDAEWIPCYNAATHQAIAAPCTNLIPYDLTQPGGGSLYTFNGHTDVKELALYVQDYDHKGKLVDESGAARRFLQRSEHAPGSRAAAGSRLQHQEDQHRAAGFVCTRAGDSVQRESRAGQRRMQQRRFESAAGLFCAGAGHAVESGMAQRIPCRHSAGVRKYLVFSGEYIWKYTHDGYDFSILGNTPITFPVEWERSKIPGYAGRVSVPNLHGFSALAVFSSVAARFFTPQVGGAGAVPSAVLAGGSVPFRIDHDEKFNLTTHLQYQPWKTGPWFGFNWRYDSGLVAGQTPCYGGNCAQTTVDSTGAPAIAMTDSFGVPFSADQEFEAGLFCGPLRATPTQALPNPCPLAQFGSSLLQVPAPNTENDDKNPPRIAPRNLFDVAVGHDNIFKGDKLQSELAPDGHQRDQQVCALQLSLDVQRNALRHAANPDGGNRVPLLRQGEVEWGAVKTRLVKECKFAPCKFLARYRGVSDSCNRSICSASTSVPEANQLVTRRLVPGC